MNTIKLSLKTLTPLNIGCGEKVYPFEYWIESGFVHICSFEKFLKDVTDNKLQKNYTQLIDIIKARRSFLDILNMLDLSSQRSGFLLRKVKGDIESNVELETFISHPNGGLYIPGSSIKGAIEATLLSDTISDMIVRDIYSIGFSSKRIDFDDPKNIFVPDIELKGAETEIFRVKRLGMSVKDSFSRSRIDAKSSSLGAIECIEGQWNFEIRTKLDASSLIRKINAFYLETIREIKKIQCVNESPQTLDNLISIENSASGGTAIIQLGKYGDYFTKSWGSLIKAIAFRKGLDDENLIELRKRYKFGKIPSGRRRGEYGEIFPKTFPVTSAGIPFGWALLKLE